MSSMMLVPVTCVVYLHAQRYFLLYMQLVGGEMNQSKTMGNLWIIV